MANALSPCKVDFLSDPNLKHDELAKAIVTTVEEELPSELLELLGEDFKADNTFDIPRLPQTLPEKRLKVEGGAS